MSKIDRSIPANETYKDLERWVNKLIHQAAFRWPNVNTAELRSAAYLGYCVAYQTYEPDRGAFSTWVGLKVKTAMLEYVRAQIAKAKKVEALFSQLVPDPFAFDTPEQPKSKFRVNEWLHQLSPDAKKVAKLVLFDPPIDIKLLLKQFGEDRKDAYRRAIKTFLTEINWSRDRIKKAFQEIKESL